MLLQLVLVFYWLVLMFLDEWYNEVEIKARGSAGHALCGLRTVFVASGLCGAGHC